MKANIIFDFGKNWQTFSLERVDQKRLRVAMDSLQALLQRETLEGVTVLDIGCGSGLFAIAAHQLGALTVTGIDINPRCIAVSEQNQALLVPEAAIKFVIISALDKQKMNALGQFDLVYAWGSLHHTGAMWQAIENATRNVAQGGTFVLAIYNQHITSPIWSVIKRVYNVLPAIGQYLMALIFSVIIYIAKLIVTRRNPLEKERGMDFWIDVIDWIGGYPYEYATRGQVQAFVEKEGFVLTNVVPAQVPTGCNEFVFKKV